VDQQNPEQGWQQLQAHIESFFNRTLASDKPRVEYKPQFIALLTMSSEHHQSDLQETVM
jgi:hypothetical protein